MFLTTLFGAMSTYGNLEVLDITFTDALLSGLFVVVSLLYGGIVLVDNSDNDVEENWLEGRNGF